MRKSHICTPGGQRLAGARTKLVAHVGWLHPISSEMFSMTRTADLRYHCYLRLVHISRPPYAVLLKSYGEREKAAFGREKAFGTRMANAAKPIDISIAWPTPASRAMRIHAKSRYAFSKLYPYGNETTLFCMPFRGLIPSLPRFPLPRQTKRDPPNHRV